MCKGKPPELKEQWNFKEYSNLSNDDSSSITNENESADQKTDDEIVLAKSWAALDEEMRDVHHLINEFSHIVVSIFILLLMTTRYNYQNLSS